MENKSYKGLVWWVVILIILVLGLGGFIAYEKVFIKEIEKTENSTTLTQKDDSNLNDDISDVNILAEFPKENGKEVLVSGSFEEVIRENGFLIDHKTKYKNMKAKVLGTDIAFTYNSTDCELYEYEDGEGNITSSTNWCLGIDVSIENNKLLSTSEDYNTGQGDMPYIMITDKYIIVQTGQGASPKEADLIKIYDIQGNLLKKIENASYVATILKENTTQSENIDFYDLYIKLIDDKVYYLSYDNIGDVDYESANIKINYIDLKNNYEVKTIKTYKGCISEWTMGCSID